MIFRETKLSGAFIIEVQRLEDDRGFFGRSFCCNEFTEMGLNPDVAQCNISFNRDAGTLRGMHYQAAPHAEEKLVRCTRGGLYDVIVDLRRESPTFKQWIALELTEDNCRMLYIPKGFAHGFQALADNTEIFYQMSEFYHPESVCGVRWNDPVFGIQWPAKGQAILSDRDRNWPDYRD
ncbi:MAG: dTDP-4-dehydrorhamnose 3,5-epimerase [Proteobacteria bacterium]|jgi:dTDP-4-dehydrorhamnose 3,5-epimerase|nr:dTDP-4-dehydrorhamnose 3,5-epimerase [Pseudomonadota bacterium]